jgi:hypothetical protein
VGEGRETRRVWGQTTSNLISHAYGAPASPEEKRLIHILPSPLGKVDRAKRETDEVPKLNGEMQNTPNQSTFPALKGRGGSRRKPRDGAGVG